MVLSVRNDCYIFFVLAFVYVYIFTNLYRKKDEINFSVYFKIQYSKTLCSTDALNSIFHVTRLSGFTLTLDV